MATDVGDPFAGEVLVLLPDQYSFLAVTELARGEKASAQRAADAPEQQGLQNAGTRSNFGDQLAIGSGVLVRCGHVVRHHQRVVVTFTVEVHGHLTKHGRAIRVLEVAAGAA